tara:strand:+ start:540 stop:707 length:168 start_codon:yes stop_codon:yes gene_type:complete
MVFGNKHLALEDAGVEAETARWRIVIHPVSISPSDLVIVADTTNEIRTGREHQLF